MHERPISYASLSPVRRRGPALPIAGLAVVIALSACAETHWERAVYEGLRRSPPTGERVNNPAPAPDAALPDYRRYEQERQGLRAGSARSEAAAASAAGAPPTPRPSADPAKP